MQQGDFLGLLQLAFQKKGSDIHLAAGTLPVIRIGGELRQAGNQALTDEDLRQILDWIISEKSVREKIPTIKEYDGSFEVKNLCRFRYNVFRARGRFGIIFRIIPSNIPTIEDLGLPSVLKTIAESSRGLVLVTGATGSGKSSTLAAMIDYINTRSAVHILTIEDPVEFLHPVKKARLTQREIGKDTASFAEALRAALRQDPDVILVGEMRDPETIDIALKAAETGHLVFSTVHTTDAIKTIGRLVAVFPPGEQKMVRLRLADNLVATVSQRLVKRSDRPGMIAAQEIMMTNVGIQECISDPELTGTMNDLIAKSHTPHADAISDSGGQTFEQHLAALYRKKVLTMDAAKEASSNPQDFERNLLFGATSQGGAVGDQHAPLKGVNETITLDREEEAS